MPRDYRALLAGDRCWDAEVEAIFQREGEPLVDCMVQNREELIALCELIEAEKIRSYLEIGVWTGALLRTLHRLFDFERVAACDHGWAEQRGLEIRLPADCDFFRGDSESDAFLAWRKALGPVDLVLIDANHAYHAVKRDFERALGFEQRFIAFHDICGYRRATTGVRRLWQEIDGDKREIIRPHRELGLPHSTMGIGIYSPRSIP